MAFYFGGKGQMFLNKLWPIIDSQSHVWLEQFVIVIKRHLNTEN